MTTTSFILRLELVYLLTSCPPVVHQHDRRFSVSFAKRRCVVGDKAFDSSTTIEHGSLRGKRDVKDVQRSW